VRTESTDEKKKGTAIRMITGIGVDLTELDRIEKHTDDQAFIRRVLTPEEQSVYMKLKGSRRAEYLAGRFSAKEAYAKATGTGLGGRLSFQDLSVLNNAEGQPVIYDHRAQHKKQSIHVSITHTGQTAAAFVVIESPSGKSAY
jgi:holo-[acyl-carrier protein] synthase